jgi:SAM-dependent methyltransferase
MSNSSRECPVCDSSNTKHFVVKNGYPFSKCLDCDLVYIDPVLVQGNLEPLYNEQGAPEQGLRYPYNKVDQRRRRARVRAMRMAKYFKGKDAIDVGCGGGYMVDAMQKLGANATGIDLDPEAIAFAKENHHPDATYYCESVHDFAKRGLKFDFGHSSQVIEHVGEFNEFVAGWAELLKPSAMFFLKTPDRNHWRVGEHPESWPDPPHYTQYFSKKNIRILFDKHGFDVQKMYFKWKPAMEIVARKR